MLIDTLKMIVFVSVLMWSIALPLFLVLLGGLIYLTVYVVKHWKKRSVQIVAGVLAACVLLFVCVLDMERQPYSERAARRLYERHQEAYDAVGAYLFEQGGSYWTSLREEWPEEIAAELDEVLTAYLRCGSSNVSIGFLEGEVAGPFCSRFILGRSMTAETVPRHKRSNFWPTAPIEDAFAVEILIQRA